MALLLTATAVMAAPPASASSTAAAEPQTASASPARTAVKGTVVDENGEPLIGVTVAEKGKTTNATMTNIDGEFTINVRPGATLRLSYVGYTTREVSTQGHTGSLAITLDPDDNLLDEVVVVGYGAQKKISVTGAVASIKTEDIKKNAAPNLAASLSGRLPGLATMQTTGRR